MISLAVLLALTLVNLAAGLKYPPLLLNAAALTALMVVAWLELKHQREPGPGA